MCQANICRKNICPSNLLWSRRGNTKSTFRIARRVEMKELWVQSKHGDTFRASKYLPFQRKCLAAIRKTDALIPCWDMGTLIKMDFLHVRKRMWIKKSLEIALIVSLKGPLRPNCFQCFLPLLLSQALNCIVTATQMACTARYSEVKTSFLKELQLAVGNVIGNGNSALSLLLLRRLQRTLPAGRSFIAMDTKEIPQILQQIFTSTMLSSA